MKSLALVATFVVATVLSLASASPDLIDIADSGFDYSNDGEITAYIALAFDTKTDQLVINLDDEAISGSLLPEIITTVPSSEHDNLGVIDFREGITTLPYGYAGKHHGIKVMHEIVVMNDVAIPYLDALQSLGFELTELAHPVKSSLVYEASFDDRVYTIIFDRVTDGITVRIASDIYSS